MTSFPSPEIPFALGTFSVLIIPSHLLSEALTWYLSGQRGSILSISGNMPMVLPRVRAPKGRMRSEHVTRAGQILAAVEKAPEHLVLIEHDRSLYDTNADLIRPIAMTCRRKAAEKGTVFMFGSRPDEWLNRFGSFAHNMECIKDTKSRVYHIG